jgi:isocitrate/isopropylmalate dehydrogenase
MMLNHIGETAIASKIKSAYDHLLQESDPKKLTRDLGGSASTDGFTDALIKML